MTLAETPEWVRDAIFYQIFPDRFARTDRVRKPSNLESWSSPPTVHGFKGGDLYGVAERLDYLQDLGVTALYLTPVFESTANHRYHTHDYYAVDPILGGNEALQALLDEAHCRGMRIILDGVFNHASRSFFQFSHVVENGPLSPYVDWFFVERFPLRPYHAPRGQHGYAAWWGLPALPKLKVTTPAVREFLWNVATHWLDFGIDGWRLDVPEEIDDDEFWREFRRCVKDANPEAYVVGEIWHKAARWLQGDQFDAVMNYLFTRACLGFFVGDNLLRSEVAQTGYQTIDTLTAEEFQDEIKALLGMYDRSITEVQFNLLGSHDTPRFRTLARGDDTAYRLATLFQMTYPGAPCVYYGDEIGMEGTHDPGCRGAFPWDETQWDQELRTFVRRCISLRRAHPALRRGEFNWLFAGQGVVAYLRKLGNEAVIVVLNNSHRPVTLDMPVGEHLPDGLCFQHAWQGGTATTRNGHLPGVPVAARSGVVLVANAAADQV